MALSVGTPVLSSSNSEFGTVEHVLQVPEEDLFDGIAVKTKHGLRFVDRDQISDITTTLVRCTLTTTKPPTSRAPREPGPASGYRDEGPSLTARYGRLFGREKWKELE